MIAKREVTFADDVLPFVDVVSRHATEELSSLINELVLLVALPV